MSDALVLMAAPMLLHAAELRVDFLADVVVTARDELRAGGFSVSSTASAYDVLFDLFDLVRRQVPQRARQVLRSQEFRCPIHLVSGLVCLEEKLRLGLDVTPHTSRGTKRLRRPDGLLNDWGIHHFHLGVVIESDGYVRRTGVLLFAYVTDNEAYLIQTLPHNSWTERALMDVLRGNWPDLLHPLDLHAAPSPMPSSSIRKARQGGVMTLHQFDDGLIVFPPGGGYSTNRRPLESSSAVNEMMRKIEMWEAAVRCAYPAFTSWGLSEGWWALDPSHLRLAFHSGMPFAIEPFSTAAIALEPLLAGRAVFLRTLP
jgi:hypothetical protein